MAKRNGCRWENFECEYPAPLVVVEGPAVLVPDDPDRKVHGPFCVFHAALTCNMLRPESVGLGPDVDFAFRWLETTPKPIGRRRERRKPTEQAPTKRAGTSRAGTSRRRAVQPKRSRDEKLDDLETDSLEQELERFRQRRALQARQSQGSKDLGLRPVHQTWDDEEDDDGGYLDRMMRREYGDAWPG